MSLLKRPNVYLSDRAISKNKADNGKLKYKADVLYSCEI